VTRSLYEAVVLGVLAVRHEVEKNGLAWKPRNWQVAVGGRALIYLHRDPRLVRHDPPVDLGDYIYGVPVVVDDRLAPFGVDIRSVG